MMQEPLPPMERKTSWYISAAILVLKACVGMWLVWQFVHSPEADVFTFSEKFWWFCLAGFIAQLIDGALGMAHGVTCTTLLLQMGVSPALASASVHTAKVFTSGVSGLSHLYFKNVDMRLFMRLVIPGVVGAVIGAYLLSNVLDGDQVKPFIAAYLLILGVVIIFKSFGQFIIREDVKRVGPLGFVGGLLDAIGGGGWGPIVTSNIIRQGKTPVITIGTVNTAEFFVAIFSTGVFLALLGMQGWEPLLGLIVGGVFAAPLGAYIVRIVKPKALMFTIGIVIIITSCVTIYQCIRG
jgi:uncharacterized membrane protein YfcA